MGCRSLVVTCMPFYKVLLDLSKVSSGYNDETLEAVGIVHRVRGAPCDLNSRVTALREAYFPMGPVFQSLDIKAETATASIEDDCRHILISCLQRHKVHSKLLVERAVVCGKMF